jgi:hypothetical protein
MTPMQRACRNCDFWDDLKLPGQDAGECRRSLPALDIIAIASADVDRPIFLNCGVWPWTPSSKWCGEFRQRTEEGER